MSASISLLALADSPSITSAGKTQLLLAAALGIVTVVLLIAAARFHPFIGLMLGTAVMGGVAGVAPADIVTSFVNGFGMKIGRAHV